MERKRDKRRVDLPHNTEAEKAVLGAMIRSNAIFMDYIYKLIDPANINYSYPTIYLLSSNE